jgi:hypothetical protein
VKGTHPDTDATAAEGARGLRLFIPKQAQRGASVIVQLDDASLDFQNDTGVVGRVSVQKRLLALDLKVPGLSIGCVRFCNQRTVHRCLLSPAITWPMLLHRANNTPLAFDRPAVPCWWWH